MANTGVGGSGGREAGRRRGGEARMPGKEVALDLLDSGKRWTDRQ